MVTTIQLNEIVKENLKNLKIRTNETYEDVIIRLINFEKNNLNDMKLNLKQGYKEMSKNLKEINKEWSQTNEEWD